VGRSKTVDGPYLDPDGIDMCYGGGKLFLEGDKKAYEAAGHCAAYHLDGQDIFICHGYSVAHQGASILIQRPITWTPDGWPILE
jgi:arabinan endo-1,5-alpha-L-arabinosidase